MIKFYAYTFLVFESNNSTQHLSKKACYKKPLDPWTKDLLNSIQRGI